MEKYSVSCVISTKNEEKNIEQCLRHLVNQSVKNIEIIVVDNNSTDNTKELASKYTPKVLNRGPERSPQRNYGASKASSSWLLFLDADQFVEKDVIKDCLDLVGFDKEVKAVVIPEKSFGQGFWAQVKSFEKSLYLNDPSIEAPRFINKKLFEEVNGFDPDLIAAEDWDLSDRLKATGAKIGRISSFIKHNEGSISLLTTARKKYYYGRNIRHFFAKNKRASSRFSVVRPSYLRNWRKFFSYPHLGIGFAILKSVEILSGGLGYLKSRNQG